jgi:hypothetical protein
MIALLLRDPPLLIEGRIGATAQPNYRVTGTLNPAVTGLYVYSYTESGYPIFDLVTPHWHLWHNSVPSRWTISFDVGEDGAAYWFLAETSPVGDYEPGGTATGTAHVAYA